MYINIKDQDADALREAVVNDTAADPAVLTRILWAVLCAAESEENYEREQMERL